MSEYAQYGIRMWIRHLRTHVKEESTNSQLLFVEWLFLLCKPAAGTLGVITMTSAEISEPRLQNRQMANFKVWENSTCHVRGLSHVKYFWSKNFFRRVEQKCCGYWIILTRNARSGEIGSSHCHLDRRDEIDATGLEQRAYIKTAPPRDTTNHSWQASQTLN